MSDYQSCTRGNTAETALRFFGGPQNDRAGVPAALFQWTHDRLVFGVALASRRVWKHPVASIVGPAGGTVKAAGYAGLPRNVRSVR